MRKIILSICFFLFSLTSYAQKKVNQNLFGFRTSSAFIFFDVEDSSFISKVKVLSPNVLSFPGDFGNFYHIDKPGYGLEVDEIKKYHKGSKPKVGATFSRLTKKNNHTHNYIEDVIKMAKKTNSNVIFNANILTSEPEEIIDVINHFLGNQIKLLGIELGGELSNANYSHIMDIEKYISLSKSFANRIREVHSYIPISVVAAPINRNSSRLDEWNRLLAKEDFYDAIVLHPYAKIVKGRDIAGKMLTVIPEGENEMDRFNIYRNRAIKYIKQDFKKEIRKYNQLFVDKEIWLTEWNLQMSKVTGNTFLQALFVSNQLLELASDLEELNITLATFHHLAGRTVSGSMIMRVDKEIKINTSFNAMKILCDLFRDSVLLDEKRMLTNQCFEYKFKNKNEQLYYWINWSEQSIEVPLKNATYNKTEYFSNNLHENGTSTNNIKYLESKQLNNSNVYLKPFSITRLKVISE